MPKLTRNKDFYLILMRRFGRLSLLLPKKDYCTIEQDFCRHFGICEINQLPCDCYTASIDYISSKENEYGFRFYDSNNLVHTDDWYVMLQDVRYCLKQPASKCVSSLIGQLWICIHQSEKCVLPKDKDSIFSYIVKQCVGTDVICTDDLDHNQFLKQAVCEFAFTMMYGCLI